MLHRFRRGRSGMLSCVLPAILFAGQAVAAPVNFAWDHGGHPAGVTFELEANGAVFSGITGLGATREVPGNPGDPLDARVRAVAPEGFDCTNSPPGCPLSAWSAFSGVIPASVSITVPLGQANVQITAEEIGGGGMPTQSGTATETPADGMTLNVSSGVFGSFNLPASGARRAVVAIVAWFDPGGGNLTAITYGGQAMTEVAGVGAIATDGRIEIWRILDPPTGTNSFSLTLSQTVDEFALMANGWVDVDQTTPIGETPTAGPGSATASVLTATLDASDVLVAGDYTFGAATRTITDTVLTNDTAGSGSGSSKGSGFSADGSITFNYTASITRLAVGAELNHDAGVAASPFSPFAESRRSDSRQMGGFPSASRILLDTAPASPVGHYRDWHSIRTRPRRKAVPFAEPQFIRDITFRSIQFFGTGPNWSDPYIDRVRVLIDAGTNPSFPANIGGGDFTVEMFLRASASNNAPAVVAGANNNWINGNTFFDRDRFGQNRAFGMSLGNGRLAFGTLDAGGVSRTIAGTTDIRGATWYHVAFTRDISAGVIEIFSGPFGGSGVREATSNLSGTGTVQYPDNATPNSSCGEFGGEVCSESDPYMVFGAEKHDAGSAFPSFFGHMAEVRLSDIIRYSGAAYTVPGERFEPDANTVWLGHFVEASGQTVLDSSGNSRNGLMRVGGPSNGPVRSFLTPFSDVLMGQACL